MTSNNNESEQRVLKISIAATFILATSGVLFGLLSGSLAIVFDGMFNLADTAMSVMSLLVVRLLISEGNRRYQYGFWHVEPLVLVFNGGILILLCAYALMNAIGSLLSGGRVLDFGWAFAFAVLMSILSIVLYVYVRRKNARLKSEFLRLDIQSWFISAWISSSLLVAFGIAKLLEHSPYHYLIPYVDPVILIVLTSCLIFAPMAAVRDAMRDIFLIAPFGLDQKVRLYLDGLIMRMGFTSYTSYVAKIGRAQFIEIHIVLPKEHEISKIESLDAIRDEIALALGQDSPQRWLTISFTTDERWT
ncbi:cation diffusion facilitator family transporter [Legionella sp. CNM-4043-24]|uniref:cation diffusion facilitator family transporter n=1 Tax=Legionella sp. CNM-4043-24 TaxID=3421646 RepID=UPI00403B1A0E